MSHPTSRRARHALLALWPAGLLLALASAGLDLPLPVFALLAACYVVAAVAAVRALAAAGDGAAALLVAAAIGLFAVAGGTGAPTAAAPAAMALNTAVLFAVALVLFGAVCGVAVRLRRVAELPVLAVFALGTGGFLLNLLARAAILLTGAAGEQRAVEATHWSAESYLRGLPGPPGFFGYTLVWLDLVQLAYVCSAFAAAAALARAARRAGLLPHRTGRALTALPAALALGLIASTTAALALPRSADAVPAALAFALSIPFMATLAPFLLGAALLGAERSRNLQEQ
ncbi:hypothetical protein [Nocardia harenae]|uniref:hypothetical protein n=1 Tax=Nocardia harenae TaxID=358707 RepID=UPI000830A53D|nr:hypothetical protein [Nocardia harenae]